MPFPENLKKTGEELYIEFKNEQKNIWNYKINNMPKLNNNIFNEEKLKVKIEYLFL
mgnify:CR=1 FL=1